MKKIKTHTRGDLSSPPQTTSQGPNAPVDGTNHVHYELSPFTKKPDVHGTFDVSTKNKINSQQKREAKREFSNG